MLYNKFPSDKCMQMQCLYVRATISLIQKQFMYAVTIVLTILKTSTRFKASFTKPAIKKVTKLKCCAAQGFSLFVSWRKDENYQEKWKNLYI